MTRILVVDDSPTQAEEVRLIVEASGFAAETAGHATAALERLKAGGFDLVMSDILMPGLDGYALCRRIKADWPALPVILLTTLSEPVEVVRALECGADAFLTKPCEPEHLIERVRAVLENQRLRAASDGSAVEIAFRGEHFSVTADRPQILSLLVSTFEDTVRKNQELAAAKAELAAEHEKLLRLARQKRELSALLVHDLRSPASGIMLSAQVRLRDPKLGETERSAWQNALAAAEVINRMVKNLLDISRGEEDVFVVRPGEVDVGALVDEVRHLMTPLAQGREQELLAKPPKRQVVARMDHELMRRVLQNLIDNAIRHSPVGCTVRVEAAVEGRALFMRVRDQGKGVPPELRERIFDKYMRAERETAHEGFGRGLGLAFCRMAVEAHGGRIWIEDNAPAGSTFVVRLPLAQKD